MRGEKVKIAEKQCNIGVRLHNRFDIELIDDETGAVVQRAKAENTILNQAWEWIVGFKTTSNSSGYGWNYKIVIGKGTGTVSRADINLFNQTGQAQAFYHHNNFDDKKNIYAYTTLATISSSVASNQYLTEVGIATETGVLMTHALIQDTNGNPISIYKESKQTLKIYSTVFLHLNVPDGCILVNTANNSYISGNYLLLDALVGRYDYTGKSSFNISEEEGYVQLVGSSNPVTKFSSISGNVQNRISSLSFYRFSASEGNRVGGRRTIIVRGANYPVLYIYYDYNYSWNTTFYVTENIGVGNGSRVNYKLSYSPFVGDPIIKVDGKRVDAIVTNAFNFGALSSHLKTIKIPAVPELSNNNAIPLVKNGTEFDISQYRCYDCSGNLVRINENNATIFENTLCKHVRITKINSSQITSAYSSNDLINWTEHVKSGSSIVISTAAQNRRYWKFLSSANNTPLYMNYSGTPPENNVYLKDIPPVGAIISAEYRTPVIPKDANHVLDFSLIFSFGEYKEVM